MGVEDALAKVYPRELARQHDRRTKLSGVCWSRAVQRARGRAKSLSSAAQAPQKWRADMAKVSARRWSPSIRLQVTVQVWLHDGHESERAPIGLSEDTIRAIREEEELRSDAEWRL